MPRLSTRPPFRFAAPAVLALALASCGTTEPPGRSNFSAIGRLEVQVTTTGPGTDGDGYSVVARSAYASIPKRHVAPVGAGGDSIRLDSLAAGPYVVTLEGVGPWCSVAPDTVANVRIDSAGVQHLAWAVQCRRSLHDLIFYLNTARSNVGRILVASDSLYANADVPWTELPCPSGHCMGPAVSPDGQQVAWVDLEEGIKVKRADEAAIVPGRALGIGRSTYVRPAWSPDGNRLVYADCPGICNGPIDLYIARVDGTAPPRRVTFDAVLTGSPLDPAWSPDGGSIVFASPRNDPNGTTHLWIMDTLGGNLRQLSTDRGSTGGAPAWSPDGARLAFGQGGQIYIADLTSGGRTNRIADGRHPAWSPDGRHLVIVGPGDRALYRVGADGQGPQRLTPDSISVSYPAWGR